MGPALGIGLILHQKLFLVGAEEALRLVAGEALKCRARMGHRVAEVVEALDRPQSVGMVALEEAAAAAVLKGMAETVARLVEAEAETMGVALEVMGVVGLLLLDNRARV